MIRLAIAAAMLVAALAHAGEAEWQAHMDAARAAAIRGALNEAISRYELALREGQAFGRRHWRVGQALNGIGRMHTAAGRYDEAERTLRQAVELWETEYGDSWVGTVVALGNLGDVLSAVGRFGEAEGVLKRALSMSERIPKSEEVTSGILNNLATVHARQRNFAAAEPLFKRSLDIRLRLYGENHVEVARTQNNLGETYRQWGNRVEAEVFLSRALRTWERILGPEHRDVAIATGNLALLQQSLQRFDEAERSQARAVSIMEKVLGPNHPELAGNLISLAQMRARANLVHGIETARRATALLEKRAWVDDAKAAGQAYQRSRSGMFIQHVRMLGLAARQHPENAQAYARESFHVAQLARSSETAHQLTRMAARSSPAGSAVAEIARARQDAEARLAQVDGLILAELAKAPAQRTATARLHEEQEQLLRRIASSDARLQSDFPAYRDLVRPRPIAVEEVQALLRPDEAMLVYLLPSMDHGHVWLVRREGVAFKQIFNARSHFEDLAWRLRSTLDLASERIWSQPFDAAAAHELYQKLVAPVADDLRGIREIIVVPDGPLHGVPFSLLLSQRVPAPLPSLGEFVSDPSARNLAIAGRAAGAATEHGARAAQLYRDAHWLLKQFAISVVPAPSAMRAVRGYERSPPGRELLAGFGDPVLASGGSLRTNSSARLFVRGAVADPGEVRKMASLPDTADELRAIAAALGSGSENIYLGPAATEQRLKTLDLSRFRNIVFATHGLLAGDIRGIAEPALVLTPPTQGTELDDGLLTASEIAQLKLNADWVILSACNTAGPDGKPDAEGLSGLASAFFYAGARSLLVSHWAVASDAAVAVTTRTVSESRAATRSAALRTAMLAMLSTDRPHYAHPAMWAPFSLVGDSGSVAPQR